MPKKAQITYWLGLDKSQLIWRWAVMLSYFRAIFTSMCWYMYFFLTAFSFSHMASLQVVIVTIQCKNCAKHNILYFPWLDHQDMVAIGCFQYKAWVCILFRTDMWLSAHCVYLFSCNTLIFRLNKNIKLTLFTAHFWYGIRRTWWVCWGATYVRRYVFSRTVVIMV